MKTIIYAIILILACVGLVGLGNIKKPSPQDQDYCLKETGNIYCNGPRGD
jgi:hypothetical protein